MLTPNKAERQAIDSLRRKGFAVVVFNPRELGQADADNVEDIMIERGWNAIGDTVGMDQ